MPRWPEEPLAQLSWASSPWHRRRSRRTSATRHVVARLSVETHVHRAAARRLPSRRAASQRRGPGDNTPGRRCMGGCAGAEEDRCPVFASRAASADRYDSTCYSVTRCETGHSCCRAAHWRTACKSCGATAYCRESGRAFVRRPGSTQLAPLLAGMPRVECLSVCRARGGPVWAPRAGTRAGAKRSRCDVRCV